MRHVAAGVLVVLGVVAVATGMGWVGGPPVSSVTDPIAGTPSSADASPMTTPTSPDADPGPTTTRGGDVATSTDDAAEQDLEAIARQAAEQYPTGIEPVRISVPAIGVDAPLVELGYLSATEVEVPEEAGDAGWFTPSRRPGEIGPSIIAGHVDLAGGPAVFSRLEELQAGDRVVVAADDGAKRTFEVTSKGQYPKDELPDDVFGFGEPVPELRLITCGGVFDATTGHYEDNVVVYTRLVDDGR